LALGWFSFNAVVRISGSINLDPAKSEFFRNAFYDFEVPERKKTQPIAEAASAAACEIDFFT
jgi:hypothetical protein